MKKLKAVCFSTVPFLLAVGLQIAAMYYLLFIAAIFLFGIAPAIQGTTYSETDLLALASDANFTTVMSMVFSVFSIALFAIWYYKTCSGNFKIDIKKSFHPYEILGIVLLIPGTQFMSSIVTGMISMVFPEWLEDYMELLESAGLSGDIPLLMMIYSVCLAPIGEELIFRGVTLRIARRTFPFWIANIIQALLFGIFHMNPIQGCYTFMLGLILGYVCEKGGTIYHVILFHFLFNLWGTTASQWLIVDNEMLQGLIVIVATIVGLTGGFYFFKKGNKAK